MFKLLRMSCFFEDGVAYDIMPKARPPWIDAVCLLFHTTTTAGKCR